MNKAICSFAIAVSLTLCAHTRADTDKLSKILTRLKKNTSKVKSVSTDFVQKKNLAILKRELVLRGQMCLQKPDRFAWHVAEPMKFSMVVDGESMRQWDEETAKVQKVNIKKNPVFQAAMKQMRQWFSGSYASLQSDYTITALVESPAKLKFVPKKKAAANDFIQSVTVSFRKDEKYIETIEILEKKGDRTTLTFKNTDLEAKIPDKMWVVGTQKAGSGDRRSEREKGHR